MENAEQPLVDPQRHPEQRAELRALHVLAVVGGGLRLVPDERTPLARDGARESPIERHADLSEADVVEPAGGAQPESVSLAEEDDGRVGVERRHDPGEDLAQQGLEREIAQHQVDDALHATQAIGRAGRARARLGGLVEHGGALGFGALERADVGHRADPFAHDPTGVAQRDAVQGHPAIPAIRRTEAVDALRRALGPPRGVPHAGDGGAIVRMRRVGPRKGTWIAGLARERRPSRRLDHAAGGVGSPDDRARRLDERAIASAARAERVLGSGVLDRDGGLLGQLHEDGLVVSRECTRGWMREPQRAERVPVVAHERGGERVLS